MADATNQSKALDLKNRVKVIGPDKKTYLFPAGTTSDKARDYFVKKGMARPRSNQASSLSKQPASQPAALANTGVDPRASMLGGQASQLPGAMGDYAKKLAPDVGGMLGMAGGKVTPLGVILSYIGGAAGKGVAGPTDPRDRSGSHLLNEMNRAGLKQAGLELGGRVISGGLLKMIDTLPHVQIVDKIPLLPADISGGKTARLIEDYLANLIPSSGTMSQFYKMQGEKIETAGLKLARSMSKLNMTGLTHDQVGIMLKETLYTAEKKMAKSVASLSPTDPTAIKYMLDFKNGLVQGMRSQNPALLTGLISSATRNDFGNAEVGRLVDTLEEYSPKVLGAARTRMVEDWLSKTMTKSVDPILKGNADLSRRFTGSVLKQELDKVGEERLRAFFGDKRYDAIESFAHLVSKVGEGGKSNVGRFMNLVFVLGPLRGSLTRLGMTKMASTFSVLRLAAKVLTNPKGIYAYENAVKALSVGGTKAANAAYDILQKEIERDNIELEEEDRFIKEQRLKERQDLPKLKKSQKKEGE